MRMESAFITNAHVIDTLGNVIGRDQPIMLISKAIQLISCLDTSLLRDENVVFFDPFCKAGEILLACAFASCLEKSNNSHAMLSLDMIKKELYGSYRYFALSPDERHHRLSLRTFLGNANSHNTQYNYIIKNGNYLSEIDGRLDKVNFEKEFIAMIEYIKNNTKKKKIVVVGNPPYQESDGGAQASAKPIYNFFVEAIIDSNKVDEFVLVIPARWFSAGKGLESFRKKLMECNQISAIRYFEKAEEVFPTVQIKGGVCFLQWKSSHNDKPHFICEDNELLIDISQYDIIPDDPKATSIINKVLQVANSGSVFSIAWSRKPFGLATDYFQKNSAVRSKLKCGIKCYTRGRKIKLIDRSVVTKNSDKIDEYKVVTPKAYGKGMVSIP